MRIGIVCPYSLDVSGGVQNHVLELADYLINKGHEVNILAPGEAVDSLPEHVTCVKNSFSISYNGSVSRLAFSWHTFRVVRRWITAGKFDILHIHEPLVPSVSLLALWSASGAIVATFHAANSRSLVMRICSPVMRSSLEKIWGRVAVSESAQRTIVSHLKKDAVVVPNGVYVDKYYSNKPRYSVDYDSNNIFTVGFLGRIDEKRKGFLVLLQAWRNVLELYPNVVLKVAGRSNTIYETIASMPSNVRDRIDYVGELSLAEKNAFFQDLDLFVAPNTGGESFGIILLEAMAAGIPILASDIDAFRDVLSEGKYGELFTVNSVLACKEKILFLIGDNVRRLNISAAAREAVWKYDWGHVGEEIFSVYETVTASDPDYKVVLDDSSMSWIDKLDGRYIGSHIYDSETKIVKKI